MNTRPLICVSFIAVSNTVRMCVLANSPVGAVTRPLSSSEAVDIWTPEVGACSSIRRKCMSADSKTR